MRADEIDVRNGRVNSPVFVASAFGCSFLFRWLALELCSGDRSARLLSPIGLPMRRRSLQMRSSRPEVKSERNPVRVRIKLRLAALVEIVERLPNQLIRTK